MSGLQEYSKSHTNQIVETLSDLVELESFSGDKVGVDGVGAYVKNRLSHLGASVETVSQRERGDHLLATWGEGDGRAMILCHMDTVWPSGTTQQRPFRVEGGRALGPGVLDMKAGIAITIHAVEAIRDLGLTPSRSIRMLFSSDEEVGSPTSRSLIEEEARKSNHVFCLEPAFGKEGALKTARKGVGIFDIKVTARAAHAGNDPENGVSAVEEMAHQVLRLHAMTDYSTGTTVNVGVINGGTVRNQVAPLAQALVDVRVFATREAEKVSKSIMGLTPVHPEASVEVTGGMNRTPLERTQETGRLFNAASDIAIRLGIELQEAHVGGGSDAQFAAAVGTLVLDGLGGVGEGPHAEGEYVFLDSLHQRTALLASLLVNL